jgi:UDP-N-acetylglucosamine--N-acetylmuramyl-(pentapeptide) pyrophosphoryl-undecaprenol N-acetylglucosamine transferase
MKILLSGGHLTPALALLDYAVAQKQEVVFVGRLFTQEKNKQRSREEEEVRQRGVKFIPFSSGKIGETSALFLVFELPKVLWSFFVALRIFSTEKPTVFVSFGGYLAVPLMLAAWVCKVPIVTHEQTRSSGLANKFIARFAQAVAVSYEETIGLFPANKTYFIGNPIRRAVIEMKAPQPEWFLSKSGKPVLYITGGSQGSQVINMSVWQVLPKLVQDWVIIHQCGNPTTQMNYKLELEQRRRTLPVAHQSNYIVVEWLNEVEQAWVYRKAMGIITRAGANTVQELLLLAKPAIFIPLLFAHEDEQTKNAQAVVDSGSALLIPQKELSGEKLIATLSEFKRRYTTLVKQAKVNQKKFDLNADQRLYDLVQKVAKK